MKRSSASIPPKLIDWPTAWACLVTNLGTLPGLGSLAAGRKVGYAQATLALLGFILSLVWLGCFLLDWYREGALPLEFRPSLWIGLAGLGLFGTGWTWALETSLALLREARKNTSSSHAAPQRPSKN
jgi:hypothetical protein